MPKYRVTYTTRVTYEIEAINEEMAMEDFDYQGRYIGEDEPYDFDIEEVTEDK